MLQDRRLIFRFVDLQIEHNWLHLVGDRQQYLLVNAVACRKLELAEIREAWKLEQTIYLHLPL